MKKLLYLLMTLAAAWAVTSCVKDVEGGAVYDDGTTVDAVFTVILEPQTKAFGDGTTVDRLYAGLYEMSGTTYTWVADNSTAPLAVNAGAATVTFSGKVALGKSYKVVFWAQKQGAPYSIDWAKTATSGPTVTVTATGYANDEARDAFFGMYETGAVTGSIDLTGSPVTLKRPFSQVNVLVPTANFVDATAAVTSSMTVAQAPTVLNLATKATSDPADWTFSSAAIDEAAFGSYASSHKYVAMNYVLVDQTAADPRYDVTFSVTSDTQVASDKQVKNAPLKPNGRTNIVGNIFDANFNIIVPIVIDPGTGTDQVVTTVTVTVGQTAAEAVELTYNPTDPASTSIEVAVSHPVEVEADKPQITVEPATVATAEWNLTTGKLDVTPLVANGNAVITLVFPAVTKTEYSSATVQVYVKVGNGQNEELEQVAAPTFTPAAGEYTAAQSVEIACATEGAAIYYTVDGTNPTAASTAYTAAIAVGETMTIKAIAVKEGMTDSEIATAAYTINIPATPDFTTVAGLKALLGEESATFTGTLTNAVVSFVAGTRDAVIKDATGSILYHKETGHNLLQGQTISGDVIVDAVIYNGINEITNLTATVEGTGSAVEPEVVTFAQLAANYATYESAYVKVVGVTSNTTTTAKGNISATQDATNYIVYTNVAIPVNAGDIFTAEGTVTKYNTTEEIKVWKSADLTVTTEAPILSATPATKTVNADVTSVTWNITSNTDWTITPGTGVTPSATSGNGNAEVTLSFGTNTGSEAATYTAKVSAAGCDDVNITITQNGKGTTTKTYSLVITSAGLEKLHPSESSDYGKYAGDQTFTATAEDSSTMDVVVNISDVMPGTGSNAGKLQIKANAGTLYNKTDLGSISSITVADNLKLSQTIGNEENPSSAVAGGGFFKIKKTTSNAGYTSSITIVFTK